MSAEREVRNERLETKKRPPEHEDVKKLEKVVERLDEITTKSRMKDMAYHYTKPGEVVKTNLIAGIARGVGLTIGAGLFIALLIFILAQLQAVPVIGEYMGDMLNVINEERN
ncbi:DUF5665 domain-containing protein [Alteribacillus sp. HJP-4]|uniref:DUF5665 domain-containing protein n=1 Tax=Alteribacillus sp. HJP-4 TaxID=2775394 RepID=UPI0035CD194E